MAYGLEIYNAAGAPRLRITDRISRLIYSTRVAFNVSGSVTLADFDASKGCVVTQPYNAVGDLPCMGHHIRISGSTIYWDAANNTSYTKGDDLILVFLYA